MHSVGLRHAVLTYRVGQESEPLAFLNTVLKCVPIKLVLSDLSVTHIILHLYIMLQTISLNIPLVKIIRMASYLTPRYDTGKMSKYNKIYLTTWRKKRMRCKENTKGISC